MLAPIRPRPITPICISVSPKARVAAFEPSCIIKARRSGTVPPISRRCYVGGSSARRRHRPRPARVWVGWHVHLACRHERIGWPDVQIFRDMRHHRTPAFRHRGVAGAGRRRPQLQSRRQHRLDLGPPQERRLPAAAERARTGPVRQGPSLCSQRPGRPVAPTGSPISPIRSCSPGRSSRCARPTRRCWPARFRSSAARALLAGGRSRLQLSTTAASRFISSRPRQGGHHQRALRPKSATSTSNVPHSAQRDAAHGTANPWATTRGDELVVDTIGLNDRTFIDNYRTPHTEQLHVVERFKMIDGGKIAAGDRHGRRSGRLQHAVVGGPALAAHPPGPADRGPLRAQQQFLLRLRGGAAPACRHAGLLTRFGRPARRYRPCDNALH